MLNDSDALRKPWQVNEDGILVDPAQLRAVGKKLIAIIDEVWKSGLAPQVFGKNLEAAAITVVGIHQMLDRAERFKALQGGNLIHIRFPEQEVPPQELYPVIALPSAASLN